MAQIINSSWLGGTLLSLILILTACSSQPQIQAVYEPEADFSQYQTFAFIDDMQPRDATEYSTLLDKYLRAAITRELQARGLTAASDADLLVAFNVHTQEKVSAMQVPSREFRYYSYRGRFGYSAWPSYSTDTIVTQYSEGTLNIDLVDAREKQLVWEGIAVGRVRERVPENLQQVVDDVVARVFAKYPLAPK